MSERDRDLLSELDLQMEQVAAALSVSRQAVSKGIQRTSHYLGADRLRLLSEYLKTYSPNKIQDLSAFAEARLSSIEKGILRSARIPTIPDDPALTHDFGELWIFSSRPRELAAVGYLEKMMKPEHNLFSDSTKRFAYHLPGGVADEFGQLLKTALTDVSAPADITVYDCGWQMLITPHYVVMDPTNPELFGGWVLTEGPQFARLPDSHTERIVIEARRIEAESAVFFTKAP